MGCRMLVLGLVAQAGLLVGQEAGAPAKNAPQTQPQADSPPYKQSLGPGLIPQAAEKPKAPSNQLAQAWTLPMRYHKWLEMLTPDQGKEDRRRIEHEPGQCAIPLIPVPIPKHFDDKMVQRQRPKVEGFTDDQKMAWNPMPVCPLHGEWTASAHLP